MIMSKHYLSSEYVGIGHPDKIADQISDTIVDLYLEQDKNARVAVETLVSENKVILAGEITSNVKIANEIIIEEIKKLVKNIGYGPDSPCQFRSNNLDIQLYFKPQSINIHAGVDKEDGNVGAGDQGIMFGYATKQTDLYLPTAYVVAAELLNELNSQKIRHIYTDNKSQVCCLYKNGDIEIEKIILSSFHSTRLDVENVRQILMDKVILPVLERHPNLLPKDNGIKFFINSAGPFWVGGPEADTGVTGRKIIVDTYGGFAPHGGGAFSGKDPSKVDRSATYMARHIAKNLVANGYCDDVLVQLSYAIGSIQPFSINVKTENGHDDKLIKLVQKSFDLSPKGIIEYLKLNDSNVVKYAKIASGGHFLGSNYPWEQIIKL